MGPSVPTTRRDEPQERKPFTLHPTVLASAISEQPALLMMSTRLCRILIFLDFWSLSDFHFILLTLFITLHVPAT
jgi:hypothetical protein